MIYKIFKTSFILFIFLGGVGGGGGRGLKTMFNV